jgi:hypothetical protein
MKYPIFFLLTLLLALSAEASAQDIPFKQDNPFNKAGEGCSKYKIIIIAPPKDVDLKMMLNFQSSTIDQAVVFNPCGELSELPPVFKAVDPQKKKEVDQFFKVPPFPTKRK